MVYQSWCIGQLLPLFVQHVVDRLLFLSSKNTIHLAHNFCAYNAQYEKAVPLLNLIQYNMSPCLTPILPLTREGLVKEGGWLFKTVPISIQRETSSHYDRSNPDWNGQVFLL